jgi:HTH-type transcriptional regulator / antitoxin MqsA
MSRSCGSCGSAAGTVPFEGVAFGIGHAGMADTIEGLAGWRCVICGEVEFEAESARLYAEAGDGLVMAARRRGEHTQLLKDLV